MSEAIENPAEIIEADGKPLTNLPATPVGNMLVAIERAAMNPDVDVDKMERLMAMAERMRDREAEEAFNRAMTAAQIEMGRIPEDKLNEQIRDARGNASAYAGYSNIDRHIRPIYTKHGFALSFNTGKAEGEEVTIKCRVSHVGGHSEHYEITMPADGKGAKGGAVMTRTHATGSAASYGKRYLVILIFNLAIGRDPSDDDGNAAGSTYERITDEQALSIHAFLDEHGLDTKAFDDWMKRVLKVPTIEEIPAPRYEDVMRALNKKVQK